MKTPNASFFIGCNPKIDISKFMWYNTIDHGRAPIISQSSWQKNLKHNEVIGMTLLKKPHIIKLCRAVERGDS